MRISFSFYLLLFTTSFMSCNTYHGLNEKFNNNKIRWVEESTPSHNTYIKTGKLFIESKKVKAERSSIGSESTYYLNKLPNKYSIKTSFKYLKGDSLKQAAGILLESSTLVYEFQFRASGTIEITEYDYNEKEYSYYNTNHFTPIHQGFNTIEILVDNYDFQVIANGVNVSGGKFKSRKCWEDIRLFSSKQSACAFDYLQIKKD